MHGLVNRAIERFVRDTYGRDTWLGVMGQLDLGYSEFEAMLVYEPDVTAQLLHAVSGTLHRSVDEVSEDIGTYLVSHPNTAAVRRLLRFSGETFEDFLHSLDDLPDRARLAVSDLTVPGLELADQSADVYYLNVYNPDGATVRFGPVVLGLLRAMADDYGALVLLEYLDRTEFCERLRIHLLASAHGVGRAFVLGAS
jgi:hypothetical protein